MCANVAFVSPAPVASPPEENKYLHRLGYFFLNIIFQNPITPE